MTERDAPLVRLVRERWPAELLSRLLSQAEHECELTEQHAGIMLAAQKRANVEALRELLMPWNAWPK